MTLVTKEFAILAPVPEIHLISGLETCEKEGKVAFGSDAWELFREVDEMRKGSEVEVFIYPSHLDSDKPLLMSAAWHGIYVGQMLSRRGRYPGDKRFRPESTQSDRPNWAIFWEMENLCELPATERIPIPSFVSASKKITGDRRSLPHGPMLVKYP